MDCYYDFTVPGGQFLTSIQKTDKTRLEKFQTDWENDDRNNP